MAAVAVTRAASADHVEVPQQHHQQPSSSCHSHNCSRSQGSPLYDSELLKAAAGRASRRSGGSRSRVTDPTEKVLRRRGRRELSLQSCSAEAAFSALGGRPERLPRMQTERRAVEPRRGERRERGTAGRKSRRHQEQSHDRSPSNSSSSQRSERRAVSSAVPGVAAIRRMREGKGAGAAVAAVEGSEADWESKPSMASALSNSALEKPWDLDPKLLKAVKTQVTQVPDHIHVHSASFASQPISPFALYYHDESAPNPVLLAKDLGHDAAAAFPADARRSRTVKGIVYGAEEDDNGDSPHKSLERRLSSSHSEYFVQSYYTDSAFTTVSADAIARPFMEKERQQSAKVKARRTCCGGGSRVLSTLPTAPSNYGAINFDDDGGSGVGLGGTADSVPPSPPTLDNTAQSSVLKRGGGGGGGPGGSAGLDHGVTGGQFLQQAYALVGDAPTRFSRVRQTNYVPYTPPRYLAERYNHPVYVEAVAVDRERQNEVAAASPADDPAYPLINKHESPCKESSEDDNAAAAAANRDEYHAVAGPSRRAAAAHHHQQRRGRGGVHGDSAQRRRDHRVVERCVERGQPGKRRSSRRRRHEMEDVASASASASASAEASAAAAAEAARRMCPTCQRAFETDPSWCPAAAAPRSSLLNEEGKLLAAPRAVVAGPDDYCVGAEVRKMYAPSKEKKRRAVDYHVRQYYFDAKAARKPDGGSKLKYLPQYSVSYKNYPLVAFDAVVPENYREFFTERQAPNFFLP